MGGPGSREGSLLPRHLIQQILDASPSESVRSISKRIGVAWATVNKYRHMSAEEVRCLIGGGTTGGGLVSDPDADAFRLAAVAPDGWEWLATEHRGLTITAHHRTGFEIAQQHPESLWAMCRGSGKSEVGGQVRLIWEILRSAERTRCLHADEEPPAGSLEDIACVVISASQAQAERTVGVVRQFLERPVVASAWGSFVGRTWTSSKLYIKHRYRERSDPTLVALGVGSSETTGLHPDVVILDDVVTWENARTHASRVRVRSWLGNTLRGICSPHTKIVWLNTFYHPSDAICSQVDRGVPAFVRPAIDIDKDGVEVSFWPAYFPLDTGKRAYDGKRVQGLRDKRAKMDHDAPGAFAAQYQMDASAILENRIDASSIRRIKREEVPKNLRIVQFVDFAWTAKSRSDWTAIATVGLDQKTRRMYLLRVRRAKISPKAIRELVRQEYETYQPERVGTEVTGLYHREVKTMMADLPDVPWSPTAPRGGKDVRALPFQDALECGMFYAVGEDWLEGFIAEAEAFPASGPHDDMVDAVCQAVTMLRNLEGGAPVNLTAFASRGIPSKGSTRTMRRRR